MSYPLAPFNFNCPCPCASHLEVAPSFYDGKGWRVSLWMKPRSDRGNERERLPFRQWGESYYVRWGKGPEPAVEAEGSIFALRKDSSFIDGLCSLVPWEVVCV